MTITVDSPVIPPAEEEPQDQKEKVEEEATAVEEVAPSKPEGASSESESEEEAEYHAHVPASICQTKIPEEKEEEEEEEQIKKDEEQQVSAAVVPSIAVEVSQPTEETNQEEESIKEETMVERKDEKEEANVEKTDEKEEKESGRETEESTDDPMVTPEESPDGLIHAEETKMADPTEEQEQPKMNGEASLVEVDPRPQVICCSEVKPAAELLRGLNLPASRRNAHFFPCCFSFCQLSFSCLCENLSPMYILTLICLWKLKPYKDLWWC